MKIYGHFLFELSIMYQIEIFNVLMNVIEIQS